MKEALLTIAFGALCVLGWMTLTVVTILRLAGVIHLDDRAVVTLTLALVPLALAAPWAIDAMGRHLVGVGGAILTLTVLALPMALFSLSNFAGRITDHLIRKEDHLS